MIYIPEHLTVREYVLLEALKAQTKAIEWLFDRLKKAHAENGRNFVAEYTGETWDALEKGRAAIAMAENDEQPGQEVGNG